MSNRISGKLEKIPLWEVENQNYITMGVTELITRLKYTFQNLLG